MQKQETENALIMAPETKPRACVIWLHGLGADGYDFEGVLPHLSLPKTHGVRFVFPHAPVQPVTVNLGDSMRAWYDIRSMDLMSEVDWQGIDQSVGRIQRLIEAQRQEGIGTERIVLAGFSQGGVIALETAMRLQTPLAGIMGLSTYWPEAGPQERTQSLNQPRGTPVFLAHGQMDPICAVSLYDAARQRLSEAGFDVEAHTYPMQHEICAEEIGHIGEFIKRTLLD
ncbi:alpha/beta hydrolase [Thiomicrospira sp. WB1]|uniref:alpha/beta hydrolase n=1 Tax=Thiomicrospira sp. WB1 TaxID=1685380 RepID=UPI000749DFF7|nr:alpha/beta fold hydrolase [Thiomicrospira sp. WB1]KUJ72796.1 carboxylesterase [Thiomicrospira sp. WB1]